MTEETDPTDEARPDTSPTDTAPSGLRTVGRALLVGGRLLAILVRVVVTGLVVFAMALATPERRARVRRWFLLSGDRWTIVWLFVGTVGTVTFVLGLVDSIGVASGTFVGTVFGGVISGLFSFVPIVIAVNQLTVSRVFGTPAQVREEIEDVDAFRREIEGRHPELPVSPTEPAPFLGVAIETVGDRVDALERAIADADAGVRDDVEAFVAVVRAQVTDVRERLDGSNQRLIAVLPAMMGDSYSRNVNDARRLRESLGGDLPADAREVLADLEDIFVSLDVLRQYYKALYLSQELSYLSRLVAYTGTGSFLVCVAVITAFAHGQPFGGHPLLLDALLSLSVAIVTLPFAVLLSFVVRVATIAKRTAAPGGFTPRRETPAYATHRDEEYHAKLGGERS